MDADTPTLAKKVRPSTGRRRAGRRFRPTSSVLEPRALLASSDLLRGAIASRAVVISLLPPSDPPPPLPFFMTGVTDFAVQLPAWLGGDFLGPNGRRPDHPGPDGRGPDHPGPGLVGPSIPPPAVGPLPMPDDRSKVRVGLAVADILVDGQPTQEFALSDPGRNVISVEVDCEMPSGTILTAADGVDAPGAVVLRDVNRDGNPDLLVANTGGDNVLVFPGLVGGGVGPGLNAGLGFAVGRSPMGLAVGDVNGDGILDIVAANKDSDDVTLLFGRGQGSDWTLELGGVLQAGDAPVRTALQDVNSDEKPELFILNSGSNDVTVYRGLGGGKFELSEDGPIAVGLNPAEMFVGRFDRRLGFDLVTVNTGSDDLSIIAGVGTAAQQSTTISSGGSRPDAAIAGDLNRDGLLDLVVANEDGRLAVLQGSHSGLQLAGVVDWPGLDEPTALAPATSAEGSGRFYAANAGDELAEILRFDLGPPSDYLAGPLDFPAGPEEAESELIAQLLPFGDSGFDLIAVLWDQGRSPRTTTSEIREREASKPVPCARAEDLEDEERAGDRAEDSDRPTPADAPAPDDPDAWARYVLGLDLALVEPRDLLAAFTDDDDEAQPPEIRADLRDRPTVDPDLEAAARVVDEALRLLRSEASGPDGPALDREGLDRGDDPAGRVGLGSMPSVASAVLLAGRLILQASPPRRPSIRPRAGKRFVPRGPGGDRRPRV